jgi:hypothetical protein
MRGGRRRGILEKAEFDIRLLQIFPNIDVVGL